MRTLLSIDPGKAGACALLNLDNGEVISVFDMPSRYLIERKKAKRQSKYLADGKTLRKKTTLKQDSRRVFDGAALREWLMEFDSQPEFAVIEMVASMPGQGVASMFKFGEFFGSIKGFLEALRINYVLVMPKQWQGHFNIKNDRGSDKKDLKMDIHAICSNIYPSVDLLGARGGIKDGRSDAILIGRYVIDSKRETHHIGVPPFGAIQFLE